MSNSRTILVIDTDPTYRRNAGRFLTEHGYTVFEADSANRGLEEARLRKPRFALVDLAFQASSGMDLVEQLRAASQPLDVVCVARGCALTHVVSAVRAGALDVMERPVDGERLIRLLAQAALPRPDLRGTETGNRPLGLTEDPPVDIHVAESSVMRSALTRAEQLAARPLVMVVEGEAGAGHEVLARAYHAGSDRRDGPFVAVPALPPAGQSPHDLLFGVGNLPSAFARAKGGVVYIESLLSLGEAGQERVYKLLEGLKAARAAGTDVRWPPMVIGVERPLSVEVKAGRVKAELADLLADAVVSVPPLRDRAADVPVLVRRVVEAIQAKIHAPGVAVDAAVVSEFAQRTWERNIPELISAVCRAAAYDAQGRLILDPTLRAEPEPVPQLPAPTPVVAVALAAPVGEPATQAWQPHLDPAGQVQPYDVYEAEIFKFALEKAGGCVSRAAELLGVGRATMYRKMRAYDIEVPPVSERAMARSRRARKRRAEERAQREARAPERHAS
jgi:DNA-binding NtrC family response regulator